MSRAVSILRKLIAIPSVNPEGDPGTEHTGELACAQWVGNFLTGLGAHVVLEEVLPGRPNVIGRFASDRAGKPRVLFAPHTDTVSVGGMKVPPFGGELSDGKVWGRGASDTKGTMAAMLAALEEIGSERIARLHYQVSFAGFMSEETAQHGSKHFAKHHAGEVDFAVIGEPTNCAVVHTHKGCLWVTLKAHGRSVHGSTPERGENAITKLLPIIHGLDTDFRARLADQAYDHPVLGKSTLNIGMIHGGTRANIVPDFCEVTLDMRVTPRLHAAGPLTVLKEYLQQKNWASQVEILRCTSCGPLDTDPHHPLVRLLGETGGGLTGAPWFCDAAWLAEAGVPAVAAGPGSIAQAHTADEFITVADLEQGVQFYRSFLESTPS